MSVYFQMLGFFVKELFKDNVGFLGFFLAALYSGALRHE